MITDALLFVHGTGISGQGAISYNSSTGIYGDTLGAAASQYSNITLDFGAPGSASSYPYVAQFPSIIEAGYPASGYPQAETFASGVPWGLHLQIMSAFTAPLTSMVIYLCSGSSSDPTYTSNSIVTRTLTVAQMAVLGATYFIYFPLESLNRYLNFYAAESGGVASLGTCIAWFGPKCGGTL